MQRSSLTFAQQCPLLLAAFAFMLGIGAAHAAWRPAGWLFWSLLASLALASVVLVVRGRVHLLAVLVGAIASGALDAQLESLRRHNEPTLAPYCNGLLYTVTGTVVRAGLVHRSEDKLVQSVDISVESIDRYGDLHHVPSEIRASVLVDDAAKMLRYGMVVQSDVRLRRAQRFRDPGVWDRRDWLAQQGITALATLKSKDVAILRLNGGSQAGRLRESVRTSLLEHLHALANESAHLWALSTDDIALLEAMMLGERAELEQSDRLDFQRTGSFHLLVVSGMNIAIFAGVIFWAMRKLPFGETAACVLTAAFALAYGALTDMGAPVTRAVIMAIVFLFARLFYRNGASLNALGTAALVVLLWKPSAMLEASFQMTFLSVLAIIAIASPLLESTSLRYARGSRQLANLNADFALPPAVVQFRIELRMFARRLARILGDHGLARVALVLPIRLLLATASILMLSFIMQCVMALPTALYFHRVTTTALAANSVVVPLMEALMPLVLVSLAFSYVSVWAAKLTAMATALALHGISGTIAWLGNARFAEFRVADPRAPYVLLCVAAFVLAWRLSRTETLRPKLMGLMALLTSALLLTLPQRAASTTDLRITAIDIGQGDSLFIEAPGGKTLLVDAGGPVGNVETVSARSQFDYGESVVSPYLWSQHISRLDVVAITHGHSDHMQGMPSVIRNFRPREVWIGVMPHSSLFMQVERAARDVGARIVNKRQGDTCAMGDASIDVLAPSPYAVAGASAKNDDSLSLKVRFGLAAALLSGDAEREEESFIAAHEPAAQLLKVNHHGSLTSTTSAFLGAVHPTFAVISVGEQNRFEHPRREVLERLEAAHVRTFRTDTLGLVTFRLDRDGATMVTAPSWESH